MILHSESFTNTSHRPATTPDAGPVTPKIYCSGDRIPVAAS
ncbi:hypothetical protein ACVIWV_005671 [Bradyrhizobium diazoefficiens]|jgi:hypothetical protein|uniref:Uncharacterized protein n=1 Tax=Bradyrhizobium diazoefficiens TaxID=1355477 RepID=A0A0E4BSP8_9BRAD|nr:hypothetical protein [Bradyrhizobium japonicum]MBP1090320.1 hypothetical protein [Bradyrhizobium japonicum]BAR59242.1 hypothetical protein NK6_6088 [Bradyrhizobium diazoefficiens]